MNMALLSVLQRFGNTQYVKRTTDIMVQDLQQILGYLK